MRKYAGIGSRDVDEKYLEMAREAAKSLYEDGYTLRSGGARGMDKAFESEAGDKKEILRPKDATEEAMEIARYNHPYWHACNDYAKRLHGRNVQIILGKYLDDPVEFVLYWTYDETQGGTAMGLKIARDRGIPTYSVGHWEKQYAV